MKRVRALVLASLLLFAAQPARASVSFTVVLDALVEESNAACLATPIETKSVWEDGRIATYTRVHVDRVLAGTLSSEVWVKTLGGAVGDVGQMVDGEAVLKPGQQSVLFGDGAGAMIFRQTDRDAGLVKVKVHTDGSGGELLFLKGGGFLTRPHITPETLQNDDHIPRMDGREVFRYAVTKLPETARAVLEEAGLRIEQVDWFLAHQANKRINEYIREHLGVPEEKMPMNIDRWGNTSAGTIPILVDELTRAGKLKRGELNMMLALGAGIHWGCALVRW